MIKVIYLITHNCNVVKTVINLPLINCIGYVSLNSELFLEALYILLHYVYSTVVFAKSLYQRGYSRQDILELFRLIDWMMSLPESIESQFKQEIRNFEEDVKMPYVTSFERLARQEGILQKGREVVIEVLEVRFEELPSDLIEKINQIEDLELLTTLHRQGITIGSLAEFQELLERNS